MSEYSIVNLHQSCLIQLPTNLTEAEANNYQELINQLYKKDVANKRIVFDFSQTEYIDSKSISVLLSIVKTAKKEQVDITFWSVCHQVELQLSSASPELIYNIEAGTEFLAMNSQPSKNFIQEITPIIQAIATRLDWKNLWSEKVQASADFHE
ncbi:MAG TPA: STAS domain-containing protein [Cyanophyceae cyanobacterium]